MGLDPKEDAELVERVRVLRERLGRWPGVSDVQAYDPALLGRANDEGYPNVSDLVLDVRRLDGEVFPEPEMSGGVALVIGGGECIWDDVRESEELLGPEWWDLCIAVNDVGVHWERRLDYWVSRHPEKFRHDQDHPSGWGWVRQREESGHPGGYLTVAHRTPDAVDIISPDWSGGSSGLSGVCYAYNLGFAVIGCGLPMDRRPHFRESTVHVENRRWTHADDHWKVWRKRMDIIVGRSRFMSGRTAEVIGRPTVEWIEEMRR